MLQRSQHARILKEGDEVAEEFAGGPALDAGLIAAAQAVEHYEISRYGALKAWATELSLEPSPCYSLFEQTLDEEEKPTKLSPNWRSRRQECCVQPSRPLAKGYVSWPFARCFTLSSGRAHCVKSRPWQAADHDVVVAAIQTLGRACSAARFRDVFVAGTAAHRPLGDGSAMCVPPPSSGSVPPRRCL